MASADEKPKNKIGGVGGGSRDDGGYGSVAVDGAGTGCGGGGDSGGGGMIN